MLNARTIYRPILIVFVLIGIIFLFVSLRDFYKVDLPVQKRIRSAELLVSLLPVRDALNTCWSAQGVLSECPQARQLLAPDANRDYLLLENGTLMAVDYKHHLLLMLVPSFENQQITWDCWIKDKPSPLKLCRSLP